nr:hypothetical protein Iba_chr11aCG11000 [Ipomoea batatas]
MTATKAPSASAPPITNRSSTENRNRNPTVCRRHLELREGERSTLPDLDVATVEVSPSNINTMSIEEDEIDSDGDVFINDDDEISTTEDGETGDDDDD